MRLTVSQKIDSLLFLMVLIAVINVIVIYHFHSQQQDDSHIVNVAGRQRMLSQKISKLALSVANGNDEDRTPLEEAIKLYDSSLTAIQYGGKAMGWEIPPAPAIMKELFRSNKRIWDLFKDKAETVVGKNRESPLFLEAIEYIRTHNEKLLRESDHITWKFDQIFSEKVTRLRAILILILGIDLLVLLIGNFMANINIAKPIKKLSQFAAKIGKGDLTQQVEIPDSKDEIGDLAKALKQMTKELRETTIDRSELQTQVNREVQKSRQKDLIMMHQARLAAMGEMIGNIAHQWKQPLNALIFLLYNIKDHFDSNELTRENLDAFVENGDKLIRKMSATVDDFRNFFKPDKKKGKFSINRIIKDSLLLVDASFRFNNISVTLNEERGKISIWGFANEYSQVILNILNNARDSITSKGIKGEITIDAFRENGHAVVKIKDNGGGVPEKILHKVFEPYFTTKQEGKGTGIGLYMSKVIIEDHMGGSVEVYNNERGAEFRIITPIAQSSMTNQEALS
jgi:signal transduction histidine kinase